MNGTSFLHDGSPLCSQGLLRVAVDAFDGWHSPIRNYQLSGKSSGLARAMALSPEVLLFDEPLACLDPISSRLLDDLILELRDSLGATIVMVTHELASILTIGTNSVFLDADTKTMIAQGDPKKLLAESPDPKVRQFLTRGESHT